MIFEICAIAAVVIFGVLAAALIRTLRKTDATLAEVRELLNKLDGLVDEAHQAMDQASVFLHAIEDIGYQAGRLRQLVLAERHKAVAGGRGRRAGVRAASAYVLQRVGRPGGHNGNGREE
jgi:uncharacterized protein YoxC